MTKEQEQRIRSQVRSVGQLVCALACVLAAWLAVDGGWFRWFVFAVGVVFLVCAACTEPKRAEDIPSPSTPHAQRGAVGSDHTGACSHSPGKVGDGRGV